MRGNSLDRLFLQCRINGSALQGIGGVLRSQPLVLPDDRLHGHEVYDTLEALLHT